MPRTSTPRKQAAHVVPKAALAKEVAKIVKERGLTQVEAARLIKDAPSQLSLIVTGKLRGFSSERLMRMLSRLGRDIEIVIRGANSGGPGRVRLLVRRSTRI